MTSLEEIIDTNYCGIGEDKSQCLQAVKEWLIQKSKVYDEKHKQTRTRHWIKLEELITELSSNANHDTKKDKV